MKRTELSILIALILSIIVTSISAFAADCQEVRQDVLRLHILANSDSQKDQELKLKVRDAILEHSSELFNPSITLNDAVKSAESNLSELKAIAEKVIKQNGYNYSAEVYICDMYFETRKYENFTLPAGDYTALRIEIGAAKGKNWWCVLFPALCIPASTDNCELNDVFSEEQIDTVTQPKYQAKFAIIELFERLKKIA